jgi:hypothetical protein
MRLFSAWQHCRDPASLLFISSVLYFYRILEASKSADACKYAIAALTADTLENEPFLRTFTNALLHLPVMSYPIKNPW